MKRADWLKVRKKFLEENPPNHQGYWTCHYGGKWIDYAEVDHKDGRRGERGSDFDNLVVSCHFHNQLKGSESYERFIKRLNSKPSLKNCKF